MKGHIFGREVQLRHHHGLAVDGCAFPPQDAAGEARHLLRGQRHAEGQSETCLLAGGAVHQVLHLLQVRAGAVDVPRTGEVEHRVTDIPGIKGRITEETVVLLRLQTEAIEEVC